MKLSSPRRGKSRNQLKSDRDVSDAPPPSKRSPVSGTFQTERGANTRDAQIALCKILGLSNTQTAAAVSTPESPEGISESSVLRRLTANKEWIESFVEWGRKLRSRTSVAVSPELADVTAANLRSVMEKKLPQAWTTLMQAIDEGNLEMSVYLIEQMIGKASQPHTMHGTIRLEETWKGRAELMAEERDMIESERMMKMLPAADLSEAEKSAQEAEVVTAATE